MGWNTGILVLNDALGDIEKNPEEFVQNMTRAMSDFHSHRHPSPQLDFRCGSHGNAAAVFHQSHADVTGVYAIGGNHTSKLLSIHNGGSHYSKDDRLRLLKELAKEMGYRVVKLSSQE